MRHTRVRRVAWRYRVSIEVPSSCTNQKFRQSQVSVAGPSDRAAARLNRQTRDKGASVRFVSTKIPRRSGFMRFTRFSSLCVGLVVMALLVPSVMLAQSTTNGAVSGTVTDATGAVIPNLKVGLKSLERGFTQEAKTNSQ